jgi:NOL1/NOP2/fmu family ribosome biogenesis protein
MPPSRGLDKLLPYWEQFRRASLELKLPPHSLRLVKSHLYAVPDNAPDTGRLHFVRPGWWLGSFKTDRFEPGHALAMALRPAEARRTLPLSPAETEAWLRREAVRAEGENGWTLVMLAGRFPLGWGKRVGGLVKNHYPAGLRTA